MSIQSDMALMAAGSYWDIRKFAANPAFDNRAPLPPGWEVIPGYDRSFSGGVGNGFSARVYKNTATGQIVISYAGTEFGNTWSGAIADFFSGNIPLAAGNYGSQAFEAAKLYQQVKANASLSDDISFTGHSLGGGLASLMAVYFDRPATVFAAAPFQRSADAAQVDPFGPSNPVLARVKELLLALGPLDDKLSSYNPVADFLTRELNVTAYAIKGELLEANLRIFKWIETSSTPLYNNSAITLGTSDKHSIDLHVAALLVPNFELQAGNVPRALTVLMDGKLYGGNVTGNQQLAITKFVRNEVGIRADDGAVLQAPNGMLTHFAADLQKLGTNLAGLNTKAQDALIAQGIEWYYWQTTNYAGGEFLVNGSPGGLLQYTSAQGAGLQGAQNKAASYVNAWLTPIFNESSEFGGQNKFDQWSVATSSTGTTATARDGSKTQIYIGQNGADTFTGGSKSDALLAGAGNDTLNGGAGNDQLYGGAGADIYNFTGSFGGDRVLDADGSGSLWVDGVKLTGGKKVRADLPGVWESADGKYRYTLSGTDLVTGGGSKAGVNDMQGSITVQNRSTENEATYRRAA